MLLLIGATIGPSGASIPLAVRFARSLHIIPNLSTGDNVYNSELNPVDEDGVPGDFSDGRILRSHGSRA